MYSLCINSLDHPTTTVATTHASQNRRAGRTRCGPGRRCSRGISARLTSWCVPQTTERIANGHPLFSLTTSSIDATNVRTQQAKGTQVASVAAPQEKWDPFRHGPPKKQEKVRPWVGWGSFLSGCLYPPRLLRLSVTSLNPTRFRPATCDSLFVQGAHRRRLLRHGLGRDGHPAGRHAHAQAEAPHQLAGDPGGGTGVRALGGPLPRHAHQGADAGKVRVVMLVGMDGFVKERYCWKERKKEPTDPNAELDWTIALRTPDRHIVHICADSSHVSACSGPLRCFVLRAF